MQTTEIRMITDLDKALPQSLDFNFDEVKAWLEENLKAYKTMVVTEDAIGASKADKAKIRKISAAISEQRIAIKKRYMEPYNNFELKMKELAGLCDKAAENIDKQLKAFDEKRKEAKREALRTYFESIDRPEWLAFERIEDPRWMNVTYDVETAKAAIHAFVGAIRENVETIANAGGEFVDEMQLEYQKTLDLGAAMRRGGELTRMKQERETRQAAQEAAARARFAEQEKIERERAEQDARRRADRAAAEQAERILNGTPMEAPAEEAVQVLDFRCFVTAAQKAALRDWLNENGIRFCRVPKFGD